jgi:predicted PurR-regulated permease PerM
MAVPTPRSRDLLSARAVLRVVVIVVLSAFVLYLLYRLRRPISWVLAAAFIAVCAAVPINRLSRRMPHGAAVALVYFGIVLTPLAVGAILVPPLVNQGVKLVNQAPGYVQDLQVTVRDNERLDDLDRKYDLTGKLESAAEDLIRRVGRATGALVKIGAGLLSSLFALITILILSIFLVSRGPVWVERAVASRPPDQAAALRSALRRIADAVSAYVGGAIAQAAVAGVIAFIVLSLLGVPAPLALALVIAILDLIPLVGATLGAAIVTIVTLFHDFPTDTIIWVVFAIAYQQFENYVVQPRIQSRAVDLDPFIIVVAALFGGTLLGIVGALVAIPTAAAIQIAIREWLAYRREPVPASPSAGS